ncbi:MULTISPECIES: DUF2490 domain-containing protein [unclassified Imperialibacter]|uniref:DUF2490 domain-containing protein n=1 Tax=unclassified Imperialibacter TaxID=2629706 RepID=UPI001258FD3C|nr:MULTISPECIES: DUF2490 domain-containing protein [unclassified Imperialibacter]CAD5253694.1 exported hypothetical protein [Imperialibacter sp. 75]CAD5262064.1 exported hypothetical protein [Imperialibacter sp. 89]VVT35172.1 exported hypothetical protein [Imperialibacter sp. EC-SDR9]
MRFFLFGALLLVNLQYVSAQSLQSNTNFQLWIDPTVNYSLSTKTRFSSDVYYRTRLNDIGWKQTVLRPGISHSISEKVTVLGGVGWFRTKDHETPPRNEIRYWAGLQYTHHLFWKVDLQHYFRAEERVFYQEGADNYQNLRLRYRLGLNYLLKEKDENGKSAQLALQYEPFLTTNSGHLSDQFFNTERLYLGVSNSLSPAIRVDAYYMLQWGRTLKAEQFYFTDHIIQVKFVYTINPL